VEPETQEESGGGGGGDGTLGGEEEYEEESVRLSYNVEEFLRDVTTTLGRAPSSLLGATEGLVGKRRGGDDEDVRGCRRTPSASISAAGAGEGPVESMPMHATAAGPPHAAAVASPNGRGVLDAAGEYSRGSSHDSGLWCYGC
jgi:hypothetical protein